MISFRRCIFSGVCHSQSLQFRVKIHTKSPSRSVLRPALAVALASLLTCDITDSNCRSRSESSWLKWLGISHEKGAAKKQEPSRLYTSPELQRGLERRKQKAKELTLFRAKAQNRLRLLNARRETGELSDKAYKLEIHALKQEVVYHSQVILYGVKEPHAREKFLERYGCVAWTEEIMRAVAAFGKIVEIGAGHGQWQRELTDVYQADVLAFDNSYKLPLPKKTSTDGVLYGDERNLLKYPDRTLLLVYPPPGLAKNCLKLYKGEYIIYVGEGEGGVNATREFFEELRKNWELVKEMELENFPECFEKAYIVRRKEF